MARPGRNSLPEEILNPTRTFFATTKTSMGRRLLQSERNATLLINVLRELVKEGVFELHDFVVMPDHLHLLLTIGQSTSIEKAMQMVKGRFSRRLSADTRYKGEVWQRGFSEAQVMDRESYLRHREYITQNPVKAGLVVEAEEFPFCFGYLVRKKTAAKQVVGNG